MEQIVAATGNRHKLQEMEAILAPLGMRVLPLAAVGLAGIEIEEDGKTFAENSRIKAEAVLARCGLPTIADDSGLAVDCLGGAPGVYSARFAGPACDDGENIAKLLRCMEGVPAAARGARFVCVITLLYPDGRCFVAQGTCGGRILEQPAGEGGFGYDPVFLPDGYDRSFAQLSAEEKNRISHRGAALRELARLLAARP